MDLTPVLEGLRSKDPTERIQTLQLLSQSILDIALDDIGLLMDALRPTLKDINFKVCEASLNFLNDFLGHIDGKIFQPFFSEFINLVTERLGDNKSIVREKAFDVILQIGKRCNPKDTFLALREGFLHKNWKVREGVCLCFIKFIQTFGPKSIPILKILPDIESSLEDSISGVRETAILAIEEMYKYFGEELIEQLREHKIRSAQLKLIEERVSTIEVDENNRISLKPKQTNYNGSKTPSKTTKLKIAVANNNSTNNGNEVILDLGEDSEVNPIYIKENDLPFEFEELNRSLNDSKSDWKNRLNSIRRIRGLIYGGAQEYQTFLTLLQIIKESLSKQLVDLRSTIVKESCLTLNLLAKTFGPRLESFSDHYVPILLKNTVVTIQIIAESSNNCIRTLITHAKLNKSIPIILEKAMDRKNHVTMRSRCSEYISLIIRLVEPSVISKYLDDILKAVKITLSDASSSAREGAKQSFTELKEKYPEKADKLFNELDPSTKKKLGLPVDNSSGSTSPTSSNGSTSSNKRKSSFQKAKTKPSFEFLTEEPIKSPNRKTTKKETLPQSSNHKKPPSPRVNQNSIISPKKSPSKVITFPYRAQSSKQDEEFVAVAPKIDIMDISDDFVEKEVKESLSSILKGAKSLDYKVKLTVFEKLESLMNTDRCKEIRDSFPQVMNVYIEALGDINTKVVEKTLSSIIVLIEKLSNLMEPYLERLFFKLFTLLTDERTKQFGEIVLTKLGNSYTSDILIPSLFKVSDNHSPKVRIACLEFLMHVLQGSSTYLSYPSHMRFCIKKATTLLQQNITKPLENVIAAVLLSLHKIRPSNFIEQLLALPLLEQNPIRAILQEKIPDFDCEINSVSKKHKIIEEQLNINQGLKTTDQMLVLPTQIIEKFKPKEIDEKVNTQNDINFFIAAVVKHRQNHNLHQVYRCLFDISEMSRQKNAQDVIWKHSFDRLLFFLFDLFLDEDEVVREKSLFCVKSLLKYQTENCIKYVDIIFGKIMEKINDKEPPVNRAAEAVIQQFMESIDPLKSIELLKPLILSTNENEAVLAEGIKLLSELAKRIPPQQLIVICPSVSPSLFEALKSNNVNTRKAAVYCLVNLHLVLGQNFDVYLKRLSNEHQKLIQIYIKKASDSKI
ncbi:hypothetical protein ABK040_011827 [Willaertia magna]